VNKPAKLFTLKTADGATMLLAADEGMLPQFSTLKKGERVKVTYKNKKVEALIEGRPEVLIHDGKLYEQVLTRTRITRHELNSALRAAGCSHGISLERVAQRAAEHNGRIVHARGIVASVHAARSFDGCGSCPFFALAASQEFAQMYPLTTDTAMQAPLRQA